MSPRHFLVPTYLSLCILLGGASLAGYLSNLLLQLMAIPILAAALIAGRHEASSRSARQLGALLILLVCLFAVQLVPLPPVIWTGLPGREAIIDGFAMLGLKLQWMPLSLSPSRTIASLLWLLPAFAVLLAINQLGAFRPSVLAWTLVGATMVSIGIGAIQIAGGASSAAYFYDITNWDSAVGFFANANHMATLLLVSIPFVAALLTVELGKGHGRVSRVSGFAILCGGMMLVIAIGLVINTSLAGLGLAVPVVAASALMIRASRKPIPAWTFPLVLALGAAALIVVLTGPFGNNLTGAEARVSSGSRYTAYGNTLSAAKDYAPVGSGIGTFAEIYRTRENPAEVVSVYMNHAHSDLLEVVLETGLPGLLLVGVLLAWWSGRARAIWSAAAPDHYARAATIASAAILAHSVVDYPLRTAAISAIFAACLALMAEPRPMAARSAKSSSGARHLSAD